MAIFYENSVIEEIKYRCDIEDIVSSYITLKKAGSNMLGLCPFHSEKTPSFTVFSSNKNFYCFGCGAGGDVITFIKRIENLDYTAAIEFLAKRAGISLIQKGEPEKSVVSKQRMLEMNVAAARFFCENLMRSDAAGEYLSQRGLTGAVVKHFGLGFAPESFGSLTSHMTGLGYTENELVAGFLCKKNEKTGRLYDVFRGRVMFPIIDVSGNVVAFGGRVLGDAMPKYLNSSDTTVFKKSRNLFALNYAKNNCSEHIILCEGYMDVIALHAAGFPSAVATLGTAITADQARIMQKYTGNVIISYDSDAAGQRAVKKAFSLLEETGLSVSVLRTDGAKDPDEYIKKFGAQKFRALLEGSVSRFEFEFSNILSRYDLNQTEEKIKAAQETAAYIAGVYSAVKRELYIKNAADRLAISDESIKKDVDRNIRKNIRQKNQDDRERLFRTGTGIGDHVNLETAKNPRAAAAERAILGIMLAYPEVIPIVKKGEMELEADNFVTSFGRRVFCEIMENFDENENFDIGFLGNSVTDEEMGQLTKLMLDRLSLGSYKKEALTESINTLKKSAATELEDIIEMKKLKKTTDKNNK